MRTLLSESQIQDGVSGLARQVQADFAGRPLTIVGVLTGSMVLLADLIRRIELPLKVGLVQARSYRGAVTERSTLSVNPDLLPDVSDRDVLLVDDIFDTGHTLLEVISQLDAMHPRSIRSAVLLRKADRCEVAIQPDYAVFDIPNEFVVGYGLDYNDLFRNLPYVAALDAEDVQASEHHQISPRT
ncbi:MAG: hypoxanthine phosphoribosyltransferase [Pirellulales bacterium]